jgi:hypothetical protein
VFRQRLTKFPVVWDVGNDEARDLERPHNSGRQVIKIVFNRREKMQYAAHKESFRVESMSLSRCMRAWDTCDEMEYLVQHHQSQKRLDLREMSRPRGLMINYRTESWHFTPTPIALMAPQHSLSWMAAPQHCRNFIGPAATPALFSLRNQHPPTSGQSYIVDSRAGEYE